MTWRCSRCCAPWSGPARFCRGAPSWPWTTWSAYRWIAPRIGRWFLGAGRHGTTSLPYGVAYVALPELLDAPLVTADRRLAEATGPRCTVEVLSPRKA
ncbi:hypothetical protein BN12_280008 [Nostocoides japonicum T1-X7]|uniref:Uncharacterized protein n=1 Tax=Nostocoides japonicum T1-X7 TaxID=1194083 RepID=A0A077LZQ2_9MICO|nr:hypothetical protein BN12_280008 [Tetrasphaera japonica T1-X7]